MSPKTLDTLYWDLFRKIYNPELFEDRFLQWLQNVDYFSEIYVNKKANPKQMLYGVKIFKHFIINEKPEVRALFFRMLRKTWKINPKLVKRFLLLSPSIAIFIIS